MPVDRFGSGSVAFRTGAQKNQTLEVITSDLNNSRGTSYDTEDGSAVYFENYSYAKALQDYFETIQRMAFNLNPGKAYQFLNRWEAILGIVADPSATIPERQKMVQLYFLRFSLPPTLSNLYYFTKELLGDIFIGFDFYPDFVGEKIQFIPNSSVQIPGGNYLLSANTFISYYNYVLVRIWQPRDKYNNLLMDNATFQKKYKSFYTFFNGYLPAYVSWQLREYNGIGTGAIYGALGDTTITGVGTNFTYIDSHSYDKIEIVNDAGNVQTLSIDNIISDTQLTISSPLQNSITGNIGWRYVSTYGFILDTPNNLDNLHFST